MKSLQKIILIPALAFFCSGAAHAADLLVEKIQYSDVYEGDLLGIQVDKDGKVYDVTKHHETSEVLSKEFVLQLSPETVSKIEQLVRTIKGPLDEYRLDDCWEGANEFVIFPDGAPFVFAREGGCEGAITKQQNAYRLKDVMLNLWEIARIYPVETERTSRAR